MSKTRGKEKSAQTFTVQTIPFTPEQRATQREMLATPCPYCSDPKTFQRELTGKGEWSHTGGIVPIGKFWARDESGGGGGPFGMVKAPSYFHGDHYRITFTGKHFIERFKDFSLNIITFPSTYSAWSWATTGPLLFMLSAGPAELARRDNFNLDVQRLTHRRSPVVVDAHTWFSHGSVITFHHLPRELSSSDVSVMQEAFEFFRPEERGAPKFTEADLRSAIQAAGPSATQADVAKKLGVTTRTLQQWASRNGFDGWQAVKSHYAKTT